MPVHRIWLRATSKDICRALTQLLLALRDRHGPELFAQFGAMVLSSRIAARATRALNTAVCMRRVRRANLFTIKNSFSPDRCFPSYIHGFCTYRAVKICGATSD